MPKWFEVAIINRISKSFVFSTEKEVELKKYSIKKFWNWLTRLRKVKYECLEIVPSVSFVNTEYRFCQTRTEAAFYRLDNNWDTYYGAIRPSPETIQLARTVFEKFPIEYTPEIAPNVDGSISLCWNLDLVYVLTLKHGSVPIFGIETTGGYILYDEANLDMDVELSEFPEFLVKYFDEK